MGVIRKKHFVISAALAYSCLIVLFLCLEVNVKTGTTCDADVGCLILHYILGVVALVLIASGIIVYFTVRSTNRGFCVKILLVGVFLVYISVLLGNQLALGHRFGVLLRIFGSITALLWWSVLALDLWQTLKNDQQSLIFVDLKFFRFYAFGVSILYLTKIALVQRIDFGAFGLVVDLIIVSLVVVGAITGIIAMILSAVKLYQVSKSQRAFDRERFEQRKVWFWMSLEVLMLFLITPFIYDPMTLYYASMITLDIIQCFSAFLIFAIFVLDGKVRLLISEDHEFMNEQDLCF